MVEWQPTTLLVGFDKLPSGRCYRPHFLHSTDLKGCHRMQLLKRSCKKGRFRVAEQKLVESGYGVVVTTPSIIGYNLYMM